VALIEMVRLSAIFSGWRIKPYGWFSARHCGEMLTDECVAMASRNEIFAAAGVEGSSEGADVDRPPVNEFRVHRPGAASAFFVYQAGFVAAGFWTWLVLATLWGGGAVQWEIVAATGAGTATIVCVVLAARYYLQRNAAARHEQVMQTLVDLSWQSFAVSARESPTRELPTETEATTGVIRLPQQAPGRRL
jgi:hypothetical protein